VNGDGGNGGGYRHGLGTGGWADEPRRPIGTGGSGPAAASPAAVPAIPGATGYTGPPAYAFPAVDREVAWYRSPIGPIALLLLVAAVIGVLVVRPRLNFDIGGTRPAVPTLGEEAAAPARAAAVPPGFKRVGGGGVSFAVPAPWIVKVPDPSSLDEITAAVRSANPDYDVPDPDRFEFLLAGADPALTADVNVLRQPGITWSPHGHEDELHASSEKQGIQNVTTASTTVAGRPAVLIRGDIYAPDGNVVRVVDYAVGTRDGLVEIVFNHLPGAASPADSIIPTVVIE